MSLDSTGSIIPLVAVSVPYNQLVFKRDGDFYTAALDVRVVAWRGRHQVGGGVAEGTVTVDGYTATKTKAPLELTVPLLVRGRDTVSLEVTARVKGTTRIWRRSLTHTPQTLTAVPLWISGIQTNLDTMHDRVLMTATGMDSVRLSVILERQREGSGWPDGGIDLVSEITGASLAQPLRQRKPVPVCADTIGVATLVQTWPVDALPFGRLRLRVMLEADRAGQRWQLPREPALEILNLNVRVGHDRDWRRHMAWLDGLLSAAVRDSMRALEPDRRSGAWTEVWRRVGVVDGLQPEMAERRHLLRIVTADDRFGGFGRGALSDRGRVYIRWGEPASVDVYLDERVPGAVYEIWAHPAAGLRFVFYDAHGTGDFRLSRTETLAR